MNGHREILTGYLSELSASDQPHDLFFRAGDLTTSVIVGALGLRALLVWPRLSPERGRWWVVAAASLILFSVATFLDSFFSMDCSPTLSPQCRVLEETGQLSAVHYAHSYTSVAAQTGIVTSMIGGCLTMLRAAVGGRLWRRLLLVVCIGEVAALTVMMTMLAAGLPAIGYPQVLMVALASVWFAAVGVELAHLTGRRAAASVPEEAQLYAG
jgi:hypothetical protein